MLPQFRNFNVVPKIMFSPGSLAQVRSLAKLSPKPGYCVFFLDHFFKNGEHLSRIKPEPDDLVIYVDTTHEPKTELIDRYCDEIRKARKELPGAIIGMGGGSSLDVAKAVSVLLTNGGKAQDYQGWDLPKKAGIYKIGIPTISGSGSEVSRTAILTGPVKKQGINSDFSLFNQIVLDPELLATVPARQKFYTGMDCYIHCVESLCGNFINDFAKAFATKSLEMCEDVFLRGGSDGELMMASLFGGFSIVYSEVGVCHALSYGLSMGFGLHHGEGNCVAFNYLDEYYPDHVPVFREMLKKSGIELPKGICKDVSEEKLERMVDASLVMERALANALGPEWKQKFTREKVKALFRKM